MIHYVGINECFKNNVNHCENVEQRYLFNPLLVCFPLIMSFSRQDLDMFEKKLVETSKSDNLITFLNQNYLVTVCILFFSSQLLGS